MQYLLLFFTGILLSGYTIGQSGSLVEYKEGKRKLNRLLGNAYVNNLMKAYDPEPDTNAQYCDVLFSVDSSGKIGDRIGVTMLGDTTKPPTQVIEIIRKTDGQWINHTGRTIWVEQSFSYRYKDPDRPRPSPLPIRVDIYERWKVDYPDLVRLEPIPCESYGPIGDHKLSTDAIKSGN